MCFCFRIAHSKYMLHVIIVLIALQNMITFIVRTSIASPYFETLITFNSITEFYFTQINSLAVKLSHSTFVMLKNIEQASWENMIEEEF